MNKQELIDLLRQLRATATDEVALKGKELYPLWKVAENVKKGDRKRYGDNLYTCLQDHTTQEAWTPTDAPSLWAKVLIPDTETIPEWEQPESTNAYMKGDKVTFNDKTWISDIDNNVWQPGVYGWTETHA